MSLLPCYPNQVIFYLLKSYLIWNTTRVCLGLILALCFPGVCLFLRFISLFKSQLEREEVLYSLVCSPYAHTSSGCTGPRQELGAAPGLSHGCRAWNTWAVFCIFPRRINGDLGWSSQEPNQCPYRTQLNYNTSPHPYDLLEETGFSGFVRKFSWFNWLGRMECRSEIKWKWAHDADTDWQVPPGPHLHTSQAGQRTPLEHAQGKKPLPHPLCGISSTPSSYQGLGKLSPDFKLPELSLSQVCLNTLEPNTNLVY